MVSPRDRLAAKIEVFLEDGGKTWEAIKGALVGNKVPAGTLSATLNYMVRENRITKLENGLYLLCDAQGKKPQTKTIWAKSLLRQARHTPASLVDEVPPLHKTRGECVEGPRPCPRVSCKHHLYLDVTKAGGLTINRPEDVMDLEVTCVLDVAAEGPHSLEEIAILLGITRERVRQIEEVALMKVANDEDFQAGVTLQPAPSKLPRQARHVPASIPEPEEEAEPDDEDLEDSAMRISMQWLKKT
jgi:hypothetical protein